jgi:hypothetical protein
MVIGQKGIAADLSKGRANEIIRRIRKTVTCSATKDKHPQDVISLRSVRPKDASEEESK